MNQAQGSGSRDDRTAVVRLFGEYDIYRQSELERQLSVAYLADIAVLDVRDVSYIDSTAIALLIRLKKRMAEHGPAFVRLAGAQGNVRRVLHLAGLDQVFELYDTVEEALD